MLDHPIPFVPTGLITVTGFTLKAMCNIVTFQFTCHHTLRRRRSRCGGTKHKITATSTKAACIAESFLTIYLEIECDPCQHRAWEAAWKLKLEKANTFLVQLRQRNMPGVAEITTLVKSLEAQYVTASWNTRTMFAHDPKPSVTRVKHKFYEKSASKLPQEVRPEDIVDTKAKEWIEMDDHDYDGNYEASTDPIHPVSTDYSHPLDDDDGAWILQHISDTDLAGSHDSDGFDFENSHNWSWGEDNNVSDFQTGTAERQEREIVQDEQTKISQSTGAIDTDLMTWAPGAHASPSTSELQLLGLPSKEAEHKAKPDEVISTFWSVINHKKQGIELPTPPSLPSASASHPPTLDNLLENFHITEPSPNPTPSTPPQERTPWIDGPADSPTSASRTRQEIPSTPPRPSTPPSPNSTRSWYDKQRKILKLRKEADIKKYYSDWLYISRCEIRRAGWECDKGAAEGERLRDVNQ